MFEVGGLLGLIILALDIWAIVQILTGAAPAVNKLLWVVVILLLPLVGLLLWYFLGRASGAAA